MTFFNIKIRTWLIYSAALVGVVALAFFLTRLAEGNVVLREMVASYGYTGIFFVSVISGFNLLVPVPVVSFLPLFLEAGLSLWLSIMIMILGVTIADSVAYIVGVLGRSVAIHARQSAMFTRLDRLRTRYYWAPVIALFLFAVFIPLPNEIIAVPLGFMGYHLKDVLPALLLGNGIFYVAASFGVIGLFGIL